MRIDARDGCQAASGTLSRVRGSPGTDVIVVGAGIVGASVAYHAASAGASVLLIDRSLPASGVTGDSFAWVRGPSARDAIDGSTPLRRTALEDWARLERDVPGVLVRWSGSLAWGEEARSHDDMLGADERLVDADEIRRLEPNLRAVLREAIWRPRDGAVDPVAVTEALIDAARRHGAQVRLGESVRGLRMQDGAVVGVDTSMGTFASRTVVLAAGVEVPTLCAAVGVDLPIAASPAVLMRFDASPGLLAGCSIALGRFSPDQRRDGSRGDRDGEQGRVAAQRSRHTPTAQGHAQWRKRHPAQRRPYRRATQAD